MLSKTSGWSRAEVRGLRPDEFNEYLSLAGEEEQRRTPENMFAQLLKG